MDEDEDDDDDDDDDDEGDDMLMTSCRQAAELLQSGSPGFMSPFLSALRRAPFGAYFFECPPVTAATFDARSAGGRYGTQS
jgi:hypothetical protein